MNYNNLCINCMKEKGADEHICPHCGFDETTYSFAVSTLPPYTILKGQYIVGRMLGAGGFGITYIGLDTALDKVVAIKEFYIQQSMYRNTTQSMVLSVTTSTESQQKIYEANKEKFEIEAKTLAQLDNIPGIVRVYNFFQENATLYFVMEYLPGMTLKEYVKKNGKMSFDDILKRMSPVMDSLERVHQAGIIHRDISPDNIMVSPEGTLTLYDFGGAKVKEGNGASTVIMAKAGYSPIEQLHSGGEIGPWVDVYSLCATMYYCVTGQVPADAPSRIDGADSLISPGAAGSVISRSQEKALLKGMSVKYKERYQTMRALKDALGGGVNDIGIGYPPPNKRSVRIKALLVFVIIEIIILILLALHVI